MFEVFCCGLFWLQTSQKAPLTFNMRDLTLVKSTTVSSPHITGGGRDARVKGRVGVWEVYCACEFWNGLL